MADEKDEGYLSVSDEMFDIQYGSGGARVKAGFKALGKGIFNVGRFAVKEVVPKMEEMNQKNREQGKK